MSVFPSTLSQVLAVADLSATIPAGSGPQYNVSVVTPTGGEFVILMNRSFGTDPAAVIMDSNLKLIQTYTTAQLNGWGIVNGQNVFTDAARNVALRDHWFTAFWLSTVNAPPSGPTNTPLFGASFSSPAALINEANFQIAGNNLTYTQYDSSWGLPAGRGPFTVNVAGGNYYLNAVFNVDDTPTAGEVVLVLSDSSNSFYFVAIPLFNILNNSVVPPLFSNYPYTTLKNIDSSSIGFAGDSLVAYSYDSNSLKRYSLTPPFKEAGSVSVAKNNSRLQYAYKMTGGYSVVYDEDARSLTKVANWW
jgi:hypothetical protein